MPTLRKARALRPGDTIGIATPAGPIDEVQLQQGEALVRELGFEPRRAPGVTARAGYLAGDDDARSAQLTELVKDPAVHGIWCARGGYGCHRIMSRLDPATFRKAAKPLVGYSDITTLLLWQRSVVGLMGIHGPMLERASAGRGPSESHRALARALMGVGDAVRLEGKALVGGWREGRLIGGSLSLIVGSLGTPWEIDTRDAILLLEEVSEAPYRLDRMLQQLKAAGKLEVAAGFGIGGLVGCDAADAQGPTALDVLTEILVPLGVPTLIDLPFGHGEENQPWPHGGRAAIDADRGEIELLDFAVARR